MKLKKSGKITKTGMIAALLAALLAVSGCGGASQTAGTDGAEEKTAVLVVSFGTSYNDSRDKTIGAVETAIADAYPDCEVRRAFTSQIIIDKLKERDGLEIDNVEQALDRLAADGVKKVAVQPTHVMSGYEYDDIAAAVEDYRDKFDAVSMGAPLLTTDADYSAAADALAAETAAYVNDGAAVVFMGHGTEHEANEAYSKLQQTFADKGKKDIFIGTVESTPTLEDTIAAVKAGGYTKAVLEPLMVVAGDHANNDMAGDEDGSWKTEFEKAGFSVECVLKGMGEIPEIQQLYVSHTADALAALEE